MVLTLACCSGAVRVTADKLIENEARKLYRVALNNRHTGGFGGQYAPQVFIKKFAEIDGRVGVNKTRLLMSHGLKNYSANQRHH
jgi:hypothetical protein